MDIQRGLVIHIVDDDPGVRCTLRRMLEPLSARIHEFDSAEAFLAGLDLTGWDAHCLLLDIAMPGMDGISLQELLRERGVETPIIFVTGMADVSAAMRAVHGGAFDLIEKPIDRGLLLERVSQALALDSRRQSLSLRRDDIQSRLALLSKREREVLELMLNGLNSKVIADALGIATKTLLKHRSHVLRKMNVKSDVELVLMMAEAGLSTRSVRPGQPAPVHRS